MIGSLGIIWIGYTMIWYGVKQIQGPGIGILDVISPSRISKMDSQATSAKASAQSVQAGINTNYSQALTSMGPATPSLPAAFTPGETSGAQANYGQALQSMQP